LWDGLPAPTYAYQWLKNGAEISGAISANYTIVAGDEGANLSCRVTATNSNGQGVATSNPIGPVSLAPPINYKGSNSQSPTLVSIPTHVAGDLIIATAYQGSYGTPVPPAGEGWTQITTLAAGALTLTAFYKFAASTSETVGSWDGTEYLNFSVYGGVGGIGASAIDNIYNEAILWPAVTLQEPNESWVFCIGAPQANGVVKRTDTTRRGTATYFDVSDSASAPASWPSMNVGTAGTSGFMLCSIELKGK
jgi:hypothetical protein